MYFATKIIIITVILTWNCSLIRPTSEFLDPYFGCYRIVEPFLWRGTSVRHSTISYSGCINRCKEDSCLYAGIQYSINTCTCGNKTIQMQKLRDVECNGTGLSDTISVYKTKPDNTNNVHFSRRPTDKVNRHLQLTTSLFSLLQSSPQTSFQELKKTQERSGILETTNGFQSKLPVVINTTEHGIYTLSNILHRNATDLLTNNCECKRTSKWAKLLSSNISKSDLDILLAKDIQRLKKDLTVNRKSLNSYTRRLTSAHDDRRSAKAIGWIGIIVISLFLSFFFLFDFVLILHQFNIVE